MLVNLALYESLILLHFREIERDLPLITWFGNFILYCALEIDCRERDGYWSFGYSLIAYKLWKGKKTTYLVYAYIYGCDVIGHVYIVSTYL